MSQILHSVEDTANSSLFSSQTVTPPVGYIRWAESFSLLLQDPDGTRIFNHYLVEESNSMSGAGDLLFYLAVHGYKMKMSSCEDKVSLTKLAKVIYRTFIRSGTSYSVDLDSSVRREVSLDITNENVFDPALRQVEYRLKHTLYPAFLASDTYLKCARNGGIFHSSDNGISCDNDYANEEDHVLLKEGIGVGVGVVQNDEPAAAKSSHRNDHLSRRFSNYAPTVSTDSELHSLSSDAITDDSYPKSDSLSEGASMQRKMRGLAKRSRRHVINPPKGLPNIPRYHQPLPKDMGLNPNEFASILIDRLNKLQREQRTHEAKKEEECLNKAECGRLKNILSSTPPDEDPESIVAAHVSRVFQDATECYSPPRTRCTTCGQRRTRPDTSSSISSGVDSGVFDAASLHSTESRTSDKRQMVLDWVKTSLEPHQHRQHIRHKTKHRLGSLSPGPQQRTTLVTFGRKPVNGRASSLERPLSGGLSVYKPGAEDKSPIKTHLFPADLVQDDSEKKSRSKKKVDVLTPTSYHMAPLATDEEKEETVVAYYFCTESIPYRTTVPCAHVTLAQFKKLITRRGRFRYFFKKASNEIEEGGVVFEEVTDDRCILPLFDGKVIGTIEKCD